MGSGRAENNAACRITNYTVQRRQGSRPLLVAAEREREREEGFFHNKSSLASRYYRTRQPQLDIFC